MATQIEISEKAAARIKAPHRRRRAPHRRAAARREGRRLLRGHLPHRVGGRAGKFDQVFERDGAQVFVDPKSAVFLAGTTVDSQQTLMQPGFNFQNPNVKGACGCGESFTI